MWGEPGNAIITTHTSSVKKAYFIVHLPLFVANITMGDNDDSRALWR